MGVPQPAKPAKLVCGVLAVQDVSSGDVESALEDLFGPIDLRSARRRFIESRYYESEMGSPLDRWWVSFERLASEDALAPAKLATNRIETAFAGTEGGRRVNLDPGYVVPSRLVLASTKDFSHRVFVSDGIYGEITMIWRANDFMVLDWTYPDYKSDDGRSFFVQVRKRLKVQLDSSVRKELPRGNRR